MEILLLIVVVICAISLIRSGIQLRQPKHTGRRRLTPRQERRQFQAMGRAEARRVIKLASREAARLRSRIS